MISLDPPASVFVVQANKPLKVGLLTVQLNDPLTHGCILLR